MILLSHAHITNFQSLRDVELEFATDPEKGLTVIRADNGVGKTTLLKAITWGLFGNLALPGSIRRKREWRKAPLGWNVETMGQQVHIEVEVGLILVDDETNRRQTFVVMRKQTVRLDKTDPNVFSDESMRLELYRVSDTGYDPVPDPAHYLEVAILPSRLRDVFFVDGDAALTFVSPPEQSDQRDNVESAVRQLLGLETLEAALKHLQSASSEITRRLKQAGTGTEVEALASKKQQFSDDIGRMNLLQEGRREDQRATASRLSGLNKDKDQILQAGGGRNDELRKQSDDLNASIKRVMRDRDDQTKLLRDQLNSSDLLFLLARPTLGAAIRIFEKLAKEKKIPNTLPEVMQTTLLKGTCICGADVSAGTEGHSFLERELQSMIGQSEAHTTLLELSSAAGHVLRADSGGASKWAPSTKQMQDSINRSEKQLEDHQRRLAAVTKEIAEIPNNNLQALREEIKIAEGDEKRLIREMALEDANLRARNESLNAISKEIDAQTSQVAKFERIRAEQFAAADLIAVVTGAMNSLKTETLDLVSEAMSTNFMSMINQAPERSADDHVIVGVELTRNYSIRVRAGEGAYLNTEQLSGAQRRALTVAFILSLAQVSRFGAMMMIDTPLGMTSGEIRREFVTRTLSLSRQTILLLTPDEISGVEDVLEKHAGKILAMTPNREKGDKLLAGEVQITELQSVR